jgi:hypothetical protein
VEFIAVLYTDEFKPRLPWRIELEQNHLRTTLCHVIGIAALLVFAYLGYSEHNLLTVLARGGATTAKVTEVKEIFIPARNAASSYIVTAAFEADGQPVTRTLWLGEREFQKHKHDNTIPVTYLRSALSVRPAGTVTVDVLCKDRSIDTACLRICLATTARLAGYIYLIILL